jgi:Flp pilus assembly pilin Flp
MRRFLKEKGQTAIEYILLVAIMAMIAVAFFKAIERYMVSNPNSFLSNQLNYYRRFLGQDPKFERFRIPGG